VAVLRVEAPAADIATPDKRRSQRRALTEVPAIAEVRVQSREVEVIDVSAGGLLICGRVRLPPGARSQLDIIRLDGPLRVHGRVLRSEVAAISKGVIHYRSAIAFERPLEFIDEQPSKPASAAPEADDLGDVIVCYIADDSGLEQHLALNGW
jgi:hypothetical protein